MLLPNPLYEALPYLELAGGLAAIVLTGLDPAASFFGVALIVIAAQVMRMRRAYRMELAARLRRRHYR